jgi:uncharacterized FlaG/YvyC family protein
MDAGLTIRPTQSVATASHARADIAPQHQVAATEIPQSKAVTAAVAAAQARNNSARADAVTRDIVIDAHNREIIYRVIDQTSRQVVRQVPEQAVLRLRAYARALRDGESPSAALLRTDLVA